MKGKRDNSGGGMGQFVALPHSVLKSPAYRGLSVYARALLVDVAMQYGGANNGSLLCSRVGMADLGWKSVDTLTNARNELLAAKLLFLTVQGHRPNKASRYAITWRSLDKSDGYDPGAVETFRRGMYETIKAKPTRDELFRKWDKTAEKTRALDRPTVQEGA